MGMEYCLLDRSRYLPVSFQAFLEMQYMHISLKAVCYHETQVIPLRPVSSCGLEFKGFLVTLPLVTLGKTVFYSSL